MKLCGEGEMDTNQRREKSHIEFPTVRDDQGIFFFFHLKNFWPHLGTCWTLSPRPGVKPPSPALERRVLTTAPPGKASDSYLFTWMMMGIQLLRSSDPTENFRKCYGLIPWKLNP